MFISMFTIPTKKVYVRLPGKGNSKSLGARPHNLIIMMIRLIHTSELSIKNSLSPHHPSSGDGVKLDPTEVLSRSYRGNSLIRNRPPA